MENNSSVVLNLVLSSWHDCQCQPSYSTSSESLPCGCNFTGMMIFFFSTANQIKDSALRVENKPRTDLHYTETNKSEVRKRETKSECNGCGAIHISFDYKVLVSSMDPLAGNAGLFTTLEQTQTSMSINSVIIIFEWIFTALPYPSFSLQF